MPQCIDPSGLKIYRRIYGIHQKSFSGDDGLFDGDRFQKAMVAVGLTTPEQAVTVMSSIESSSAQMAQGQISSTEFAQRVQDLAQANTRGAEAHQLKHRQRIQFLGYSAGAPFKTVRNKSRVEY